MSVATIQISKAVMWLLGTLFAAVVSLVSFFVSGFLDTQKSIQVEIAGIRQELHRLELADMSALGQQNLLNVKLEALEKDKP